MAKNKATPEQTLNTGLVRFSYAQGLHTPEVTSNGKNKYSVTLLIPKTDKETVAKIEAAIDAAIKNEWGDKRPKALHVTLQSGDGTRPKGGQYGPECKGHWVLPTNTQYAPSIYDADGSELVGQINSGDYGYANITSDPYDVSGAGVKFYINACKLKKRGEPLSGGASNKSAADFGFAEEEEDDLLA